MITNLPTPNSLAFSPEEAAERMRDDLNFFAYMLLPDETISRYPEFYLHVWTFILHKLHTLGPQEVFRFALGLPRGHVKTTFVKLLVVYLIIHDYDITFILVVCATEPLAENFLQDVHDIMNSPIVRDLYGSWDTSLTRDTRKIKTALFNGRSIILAAIGAQTSTRGLNIQNRRPQLIICDDAQTKENDDSDTERYKLLTWLAGTLFKSRAKTSKTMLMYLGNLYSTDCILYQYSKNPHWYSLITGAILADYTALWPELNSVETLIEEYNHDNALGLGSVWFAEVQNDPVGSGSGLLEHGQTITLSPAADTFNLDSYPIRWICIDPAGKKKTSDDNVIGAHCLMEDDQIGSFFLDNGKYDPEQVIDKTISACQHYSIPIVFIESNAYQATLAFWMEKKLEELTLHDRIKVIPLPSGTTSKFQRIKAFVSLLAKGKWHIVDPTIFNKVSFQIYAYRITKQNNVDDIIDEQAMALKALNEHRMSILHAQYYGIAQVYDNLPPVRSNNTILDRLRRKGRK